MHEHVEPKPCDHEFSFCQKCDVVFCKKCKGEWKRAMKHAHDVLRAMENQLKQMPLKNPYGYNEPQPYVIGKKSVQCH